MVEVSEKGGAYAPAPDDSRVAQRFLQYSRDKPDDQIGAAPAAKVVPQLSQTCPKI